MAALLTTARALGRLARPGGSLVSLVSRPAAARLLSAAAALRADSKPLQYTVNVTESGRGVYEEVVNVRDKHQFSVDEPTSMTGGTDKAPNPYELLSASLGACTAITIRMYANRKNYPLERVTIDLAHEKVYSKDCAGCENRPQKLDHIDRKIRLHGPKLTEEQIADLMRVSELCPVHQTLSHTNIISTELIK